LAFETVKKQIHLLHDLHVPIIGVVENMKINKTTNIKKETKRTGAKYLAELPYDPEVEEAIGDLAKLLETAFAQRIRETIVNGILKNK
jgi:MinD superfamily P-loop ATPase